MSGDHRRTDSNHLSSFVILFSFRLLVLDSIDVQLRWQFTKEGTCDKELPSSIRGNDRQAQETKTRSIDLSLSSSSYLVVVVVPFSPPVDANDDDDDEEDGGGGGGKRAEIDWVVCLCVRSVEQHRICDWQSHLFTAAFFSSSRYRRGKNRRGEGREKID